MGEGPTPKELLALGSKSKSCLKVFQKFCVQEQGIWGIAGKDLKEVFNKCSFYPTTSQIRNILRQCAANKVPAGMVTFGHFCAVIFEFEIRRDIHLAMLNESSANVTTSLGLLKKRHSASHANSVQPHCEVFLGGACNPTTWRADLAIPFFQKHMITYHNPQKPHWNPEMIASEDYAKRTAQIEFFVLDTRTRGIVSMLEVSYLTALKQAPMILVMEELYKDNQLINDEAISREETEFLNNGLGLIRNILERNGLPVFTDKESALNTIHNLLKNDQNRQEFGSNFDIPAANIGDSLCEIRKAYEELDVTDNGQIKAGECALALKLLCCADDQLTLTYKKDLNSLGSQSEFSLDNMCSLAVDFFTDVQILRETNNNYPAKSQAQKGGIWSRRASSLQTTINIAPPFSSQKIMDQKDIFLGGNNVNDWRKSIAIPRLIESGATYYQADSNDFQGSLLANEELTRNMSSVLLYYIAWGYEAVPSVVEAAYFIGQDKKVVLCFEPTNAETFNSQSASKDHERARAYLSDIANKHHVPVFDNIEDALSKTLEKVGRK